MLRSVACMQNHFTAFLRLFDLVCTFYDVLKRDARKLSIAFSIVQFKSVESQVGCIHSHVCSLHMAQFYEGVFVKGSVKRCFYPMYQVIPHP